VGEIHEIFVGHGFNRAVIRPKLEGLLATEVLMKFPLQLIGLLAAVAAVALLTDAWRSARHDSQQLAATLASQNAIIQQASEQEKQRDSQLQSVLAQIHSEKLSVHTPQQAAQKLPETLPPLPLPVSIHFPDLSEKPIDSPSEPPNPSMTGLPDGPMPAASISIPQPDLIPLYNALQDCRASQAQSATLEKDLSDEKTRSAALVHERDAALTAAHGGPILQRLKRAAKWFAIGLAAGATLAAASHH
jgi:hypothetical protein